MNPLSVKLRFFGAMRRHGDALDLQLPAGSSVADLRRELVALIGEEAATLVNSCAVASDSRLLHQQEALSGEHDLALLPPVSGG